MAYQRVGEFRHQIDLHPLRIRTKLRVERRGELVQSGAHCQDHIGLADELRRTFRSETAPDTEIIGASGKNERSLGTGEKVRGLSQGLLVQTRPPGFESDSNRPGLGQHLRTAGSCHAIWWGQSIRLRSRTRR